jgi:predicted Zn-dependent protease
VSQLGTARAYLRGLVRLAADQPVNAVGDFEAAYAAAPGEAACAFAVAAALELAGDQGRLEEAADLYEQVSSADPSWVAGVGGLARTLAALTRATDAARVLTAVPDSHPSRAEALTLACQAMRRGGYDGVVAEAASDHLVASGAGRRTAAGHQLAVALYQAAIAALERGESVGPQVAGVEARVNALASAASTALLDLAEATPDAHRRHELLDTAARTRPWSLW